MAQPEKNHTYTAERIPPFLNNTKKPEMTVKRYWSRFRTYLNLTHKIRIDPLLIKQKDAVEKSQQVTDDKDEDRNGSRCIQTGNRSRDRKAPNKNIP